MLSNSRSIAIFRHINRRIHRLGRVPRHCHSTISFFDFFLMRRRAKNQLVMETMAMDEVSSPSRIEGGSGETRACTRAALSARRAPTAADEARHPRYDTNDDPWTNDVSSADKDDATGPPPPPMGTSTTEKGRGRRERVAVDVGSPSASRRCRTADERDTSAFSPANDLPAHNDEDGR